MQRQLFYESITLGCDPELFLKRNGQVIGAEKVVPKEGLVSQRAYSTVVIDGVQVELHPKPSTCRQSLSLFLIDALAQLHVRAQAVDPSIEISFDPHVEVSVDELDSLAPESKMLGCSPSSNIYGFQDLGVDPTTYRLRSAGGHIHIGMAADPNGHANHSILWGRRERIVAVLDVLLGSFCVMLDRDPHAAERRKVYGRAGEYRLPPHGLEYRTLSNFWLRSYPLTSLVFSLARQAVAVSYTSLNFELGRHESTSVPYWDAEADLFNRVDLQVARRAINENNLELAKQVWQGVKGFYEGLENQSSGLSHGWLQQTDHFLRMVEDKGLDYWFPEPPLKHWFSSTYAQGTPGTQALGSPQKRPFSGWEYFITNIYSMGRR